MRHRWRRGILLLLAALVALTVVPAAPASALTNRKSNCDPRGPVQGHYVNVCVRLQEDTGGRLRAYGGMDATSNSIRVYIRALRLEERQDGATGWRLVYAAQAKGAWGYVNQATAWYSPKCFRHTYKAVMSYDIRWTNGVVTKAVNHATDPFRPICST
jgi:hypothetical protein